jgi:protein-L-isoaspartate(D-aspartate) O-methyltransferase
MLDFNFAGFRHQMVEQQIRADGVLDPAVLAVFDEIPRHAFVPEAFQQLAYADCEIPLDHGESMLTPAVQARLVSALNLDRTGRILEIGTGSGYLTACLACLGGEVTSVDLYPDFIAAARQRLLALKLPHPIRYLVADSHTFPPELKDERFDAIAITGALYLPEPSFSGALEPDGRLFMVLGTDRLQTAHRIRRLGNSHAFEDTRLFETRIPPLKNAPKPPEFSFS